MFDESFNRYSNVIIFATEWRKYKLQSKKLSEDSFRNEMQTNEYVLTKCSDRNGNNVLIYLFSKNSKYIASQELKKLLKKIEDLSHVILITYSSNSHSKKAIAQFKNLNIYSYQHSTFDLIIPNGPLCYPHRIMSRDEVLNLCNSELFCSLNSLPKIFDDDKQCIWIGAESGDVLEITSPSDISGEYIQYRVVVPRSGKIIFTKDDPVDNATDNIEEEEIEEYEEQLPTGDTDDESANESVHEESVNEPDE